MAYGVLYEFHRTSTNGADMLITISQKGYSGAVKKRALGRAPVIKRDNNGHIYGTSCELYAECLVDGEFSHLYTSDAYEYKVEVYKNNTLLWAGFVSPELYSEPDIAPPYDVQIIATDGLGELKNYNFNKRGAASILDHINALMANTGIDMGFNVVSGLRYIDENGDASADKDILSVKLDLDHEEGNSCYDVLQGILSSLNANITQHNGSYLIFRETDFITKAGAQGVEAFNVSGNKINLGVASFGTIKANQWWPVGQLSTVIEPAKNQIVLTSPNHYKGNVLRFDNWTTSEMASFSEAENAYVLPGADSYITQTIDFGGHQVGYRLGLRVRARNVGTPTEEEQNIGLKIEMEGQTSAVGPNYWLVKPATGGRRPASGYMWRNTEGSFEEDLTTPSEAEDASDAQDIDIVLPLYRDSARAFAYAKRIKLTICNPKGLYNIHVYDVSLVKYEQIKGYEANVTIDNMAREAESDVDLTITAGDLAPTAGNVFMTGLPLRPSDSEVITKWQIGNNASQDYLAAMAFDYSRGISLPRMKYSGILNVPGSSTVLPTLFLRDGTYYFPHTYSYDLYSDEITVELISISAADVSLSSVAISQTTEAVGTMGATTGGTSGGGGAVSIPRDKQMSDTSDNAVENKVIKAYVDKAKKDVEALLASMWQLVGDRVVTDKKTVIENDLIVEGDVATGGSGGGTAAAGTVTGVLVGSDRYEDVTAGLLDLTEAFNKIDVSEQLKDYLPLTGGVVDGTLMNPLTIKTSAAEVGIPMSVNNSAKMWVGWNSSYGAYIYSSASSKYLGIKDDGTPHYNGHTLLHKGNYATEIGDYYLKRSGGILSDSWSGGTEIRRTDNTNGYAKLTFSQADGTILGAFGFGGVDIPLFITSAGSYNTLIHSGNIGERALNISGTNARPTLLTPYENLNDYGYGYYSYVNANNPENGYGTNVALFAFRSYRGNDTWQIAFDGNGINNTAGPNFAIRGNFADIGWTVWYRIATTSSNVASATKLKTARTIWGQSFDGTGNVNGNIFLGQKIIQGGTTALPRNMIDCEYENALVLGYGIRNDGTMAYYAQKHVFRIGDTDTLTINSSGYVGIGTTDPQYKLDVNGSGRFGHILINKGYGSNVGESTIEMDSAGATLWMQYYHNGGINMCRGGGSVTMGGALSVTGAVTMSSTLSVSGKTTISNDLVVSGDVSTGGSGESTGAAGTVTSIAVNGQTYEPIAGIVTIPDYPTSLEWNAINGRPTSLSQFTDDILSGKYLPLTGGVVDGTLMNPLTIKTSAAEVGIPMSVNNSAKMWVGWNSSYGAYIYSSASSKYLGIKDDGTPHYNGHTLLHKGNYATEIGDYYLKRSGGILSDSWSGGTEIRRTDNTNGYAKLTFSQADGTILGAFGFGGVDIPLFITSAGSYNTLIHSGNIGERALNISGTNARPTLLTPYENLNDYGYGYYSYVNANNPENGYGTNVALFAFRSYRGNDTWQIAFDGNGINNTAGPNFAIRGNFADIGWTVWYRIATTSSNVASATKLKTARTIWGQSFDGTGNVNGNIFLGQKIIQGGTTALPRNMIDCEYENALVLGYGIRNDGTMAYYAQKHVFRIGDTDTLTINSSGYVGIGTTDPQYKLDVNGSGRFGHILINKGYGSNVGESTIEMDSAGATLWMQYYHNGGINMCRGGGSVTMGGALSVTGAVTMSSTLSVSGKTTISNDLVVSGDVATGGSGGGSSSGGGDSNCLGPVALDMQSISDLGTYTQAQMDGFGLTTAVINNMMEGLYTKVVARDSWDIYDYTGFGSPTGTIKIFLRQGNGESVDYTYTLAYDGSKWTVTEN